MNYKKLLNKQWSFLYAGIAFGIAQIVYMTGLWLHALQAGKKPHLKPITVTTDLGKMFRGVEVFINRLFGFHSEIYGTYAKVSGHGAEHFLPDASGAFVPGIGWPIVGIMIGGWLVGRMEKESRSWAYYGKRLLAVSFLGGILFSYGTRLAGGCTLNHLMGGVPLMNIHSLVTIIFMGLGGIAAFYLMAEWNLAGYFKHQETLEYVRQADKGEQATYRPGYSPWKNYFYWIGLVFALLLVLVAFYGGFANPSYMRHIKDGHIIAFNKSVAHKGWLYVILTLTAGIIGGIGLGKSGFGTECALVAGEVGDSMRRNDKKYRLWGVPKITRTLMRGYLPFIGIAAHWVVMLGFVLIAWIFFNVEPAFAGKVKYSLTAGSIIGGFLLGMGAVFLIGCEIRSYMRLGIGYLNTLIGFIGFAVGYLPFTLYYKAHKHFLASTVLVGKNGAWSDAYKVYDLFGDNPLVHKIILFLWWLFLLWLLIFLIKKGSRNTGLTPVQIRHNNTEENQIFIDRTAAENNGKVNGVPAPEPVPPESYVKD